MRGSIKAAAIAALWAVSGCTSTVIQSSASPCSQLLPSSWEKGVEAVDIPTSAKLADGHDDARPWQSGFVAQTGQLEIANGRYVDAVGIVSRCEVRDAAAVKQARPKVLGIF